MGHSHGCCTALHEAMGASGGALHMWAKAYVLAVSWHGFPDVQWAAEPWALRPPVGPHGQHHRSGARRPVRSGCAPWRREHELRLCAAMCCTP